ncbi:hypothetical protein GGS26DRAFT_591834 [Hypomontagnella submonticulosa]|nr:hypothetical protein GGS26DRAFT_591834 [Hypomontagnella submonticulosa]
MAPSQSEVQEVLDEYSWCVRARRKVKEGIGSASKEDVEKIGDELDSIITPAFNAAQPLEDIVAKSRFMTGRDDLEAWEEINDDYKDLSTEVKKMVSGLSYCLALLKLTMY